MKNRKTKITGFTLIELMVTISIAAILLAIGVPSFQAIIENNRLATQSNELITAVNLARSEAIKRSCDITIDPGANGYVQGWTVSTDTTSGPGRSPCPAAETVRVFDGFNGLKIRDEDDTNTVFATSITFNSRGQKFPLAGTETRILLQPENCATGSIDRARAIRISNTGRASVVRRDCA
ncbi:MAG: GspH/FimT family pseudopilin [Xanthomonadaceae bacterium]|nr:GspH/FimT family pseudopilin [Xanthomonadaceae bacterium]